MPQAQKRNATQIAFARLTKVDEERRLVFGRAVQEVVDRVGEIFDYDSSKPYFQAWSKSQMDASMGKSAGNIRAMHKDIAAGIIIPKDGMIFNDVEKAIDITVHVTDDDSWNKVLTGTFTGFSIGGSYVKKWEDKDLKRTRYTGDPIETSLVDRPAVGTATFFEVQKRDGSTSVVPFKQPRKEMLALLAKRDGADAKMLGELDDAELSDKYVEAIVTDRLEALRKGDVKKPAAKKVFEVVPEDGKALGKKVEVEDPQVGDEIEIDGARWTVTKIEGDKAVVKPIYDVSGTADQVSAFAKMLDDHGLDISQAATLVKRGIGDVEPSAEEVEAVSRTLCESDGKKPDDLGDDKQPVHKLYAARATVEIRKAKARDGVEKPQRAVAAKKFADQANKRFPIDTVDQVKAAWNYIHMPAAAKRYKADELKAVKAQIAAAWKELVGEDGPPSADDSKKAVDLLAGSLAKAAKADPNDAPEKWVAAAERVMLRKGLYTCSAFAQMIDSLCSLADSAEYEAFYEGDGSQVADKMRAGIAILGEALKEMLAEELGEALGDEDAEEVMSLRAAVDGLCKRALVDGKGNPHVVVKADDVQKLHDHIAKIGAACDGVEKAASAEMLKAHIAVAQSGLDKAHDMVCKMGGKCDKGDVDDGDEPKKVLRASLKKANPALTDEALDGLIKQAFPLEAALPDDPMTKAIAAAVAPLKKALDDTKAELERVKAMPAPAPRARLLAVTKSDDVDANSSGGKKNGPQAVLKADGTIDSEKTAAEMIKWQQENGGKPLIAMNK